MSKQKNCIINLNGLHLMLILVKAKQILYLPKNIIQMNFGKE